MSERETLFPFRAQINVVFAAEGMEHADDAFEGMIGMLEHAGAIVELGSFEQMPAEDVIPLSPLDRALVGE